MQEVQSWPIHEQRAQRSKHTRTYADDAHAVQNPRTPVSPPKATALLTDA